jgi:hypothetical protein
MSICRVCLKLPTLAKQISCKHNYFPQLTSNLYTNPTSKHSIYEKYVSIYKYIITHYVKHKTFHFHSGVL